MDVLGLALAIPAVFVACAIYVPFVRFGVVRWPSVWPGLLLTSSGALLLVALDVGLVVTLGAVRTRTLIGPFYWIGHLLGVLTGTPTLAHARLLPPDRFWAKHWLVTIAACFLFGVALVLFNVGVGGQLYGPDGVGGPFSRRLDSVHSRIISLDRRWRGDDRVTTATITGDT